MYNTFVSYFLIFFYLKFLLGPNIVNSYYVIVNIDRHAEDPDRTYLIVNNRSKELCPEGYDKYIAGRPDCFSIGGIRFDGESVLVNDMEIKLHYVYAIEAYWKYNTPLMIRIVKYHGWYTRVYPAYVRTKSGRWKEDNTYYYEKDPTVGNIRMLLDDIAARVKPIIEGDKNRSMKVSKAEIERHRREMRLFEEDKLKEKKSGFNMCNVSYTLFFFQIIYTLLSH